MQRQAKYQTHDVVAISPDKHYLAIARNAVQVWKLTAIDTSNEYTDPLFNLSASTQPVTAMRFVDNRTLETITGEDVHRWDLQTGKRIQ